MTSSERIAASGHIVLLLLSLLTPALSSNPNFFDSTHGKCPGGLKCHHGGRCATGDKDHASDHPSIVASSDLPWLEQVNVNGEHCVDCHDGWGGVDCSRRYQACDASDPSAPTCFNGSACLKGGISERTGKYEYSCDCSHSVGREGVEYAGKFCQHVKEEYCGDNYMFCTNGGKCSSVLNLQGVHKRFECECPSHRAGTHCEFLHEEGFSLQKENEEEEPAAVESASDPVESESCDLRCDRGYCAKGFKTYDDLVGTGPFPASLALDIISESIDEHCVCPDGYTGLRCEIRMEKCGPSKMCYHGSTCAFDDAGRPMCDCNAAHTDDVSYAGEGCEQETSNRCTPNFDQDVKDAFCTEHGRCIEDPDTRHEGCDCDEGWEGAQCDFKLLETAAQAEPRRECDLECNGGSCRFGVKGYADALDELNLPTHVKRHEDGMHCSCPEGFTGLQCEVDMNHCDDNGGADGGSSEHHFCLNGASCANDAGKEVFDGMVGIKKFSCQCDESHASDGISQTLAGRFCEYAVTEFCSEDEERQNHSFCTNGGKCKRKNTHRDREHHGCCCPEGHEGEYCQFPKGTLDLEAVSVTWSPLAECAAHADASSNQYVFPVSPNADGEWTHVSINPKYQVPKDDEEKDEVGPVLEAIAPPPTDDVDSPPPSRAGGIASGIMAAVLLAGAFATTVFVRLRREKDQDPAQFAADWWRDNTTEWWKGDSPIENDTNIAPASIVPKHISRSWCYHADGGVEGGEIAFGGGGGDREDGKWNYSPGSDSGSLHDVVI